MRDFLQRKEVGHSFSVLEIWRCVSSGPGQSAR
jgi:hypothetical protein